MSWDSIMIRISLMINKADKLSLDISMYWAASFWRVILITFACFLSGFLIFFFFLLTWGSSIFQLQILCPLYVLQTPYPMLCLYFSPFCMPSHPLQGVFYKDKSLNSIYYNTIDKDFSLELEIFPYPKVSQRYSCMLSSKILYLSCLYQFLNVMR